MPVAADLKSQILVYGVSLQVVGHIMAVAAGRADQRRSLGDFSIQDLNFYHWSPDAEIFDERVNRRS